MTILRTEGAGESSSGFYNGVITSSLRLDRASATRLIRTPGSASNRRTYTLSMWVKRCGLTEASVMLNAYSSGSESNFTYFSLHSDDQIGFDAYGKDYGHTNRLVRDTTGWYNIIWAVDTTQATDSNRYKLYVNGVQDSSFASGTYPVEDLETAVNSTAQHTLFANYYTGSYDSHFHGYVADVNLIDGQQLAPTSFGEAKNGVWIPVNTSGLTFGTNGFRLAFASTDLNVSGGAVTDPRGSGTNLPNNSIADASGSGNHWEIANLNTYDFVPDSPENNFCTLNPLDKVLTASSLSQGSLSVSAGGNAWNNIINSTFSLTSGKWYWEVIALNAAGFGKIGVRQDNSLTSADSHSAGASEVYLYNGNKQQGSTSTDSAYYGSNMDGDGNIFGIALDMDAGKIWVAKNNTYGNSGNPATGANAMFDNLTEPQSPSFSSYNMPMTFNFGQDGSFAGDLTSGIGTATDANGIGAFKYAPPSGFLALCSSNLSDPTIGPQTSTQADDYFNPTIYTGDGNDDREITQGSDGVAIGFSPDLIWIKNRNNAGNDFIGYNSVSGGDTQMFLSQNLTEQTATNKLEAFIANGFRLGQSVHSTVNSNTHTYIAYNWLAGGRTPTKTYKVKVVTDSTDYGHGTGSNKYQFFKSDGTTAFGTNGVDLDLQEGGTYIFDWSDSSAQSHPIRFSLTNDGTHSSGTSAGSEYTTGVVKDDSAYKTTITVASGVASLYYYCQNHSGMGAEVRTNTTHGQTNFDGSILSVSHANTTSGCSVVTYTGNNGSDGTIGHGLSSAPNLIMVFGRTVSNSQMVGVTVGDGWTHYIALQNNGTSADDATIWNDVAPTTTTFSVGSAANVNDNYNYLAWCFHDVEGFSKFGKFTGNDDVDGPYVFTSFRPSFLMVKRTNDSGGWTVFDRKRNTFNPVDVYLGMDATFAEYDGSTLSPAINIDFLSNGFKIRSTEAVLNSASGTFIYMAFAEQPFKFSNAR